MKALVTGVTGQDGSYLAEFLLSRGYEVDAIVRPSSTFNRARIEHIYIEVQKNPALRLHYGDLVDSSQLTNMIRTIRPDEIYHLGAQSHVKTSFDLPEYTGNVTGIGPVRILESIRHSGIRTRFYQASSSEMFGSSLSPQNEATPFNPRSPYACAKLHAYWMSRTYREGYGMWCSNGILFNHESPRRGPMFVTRKIVAGVAAIVAKREQYLYLGNLESQRDWGFAPEYVELMWRILHYSKPDDFVVGTGESHSVREFAEATFDYAGLSMDRHVKVDDRYLRPLDVSDLCADATKARRELGWNPRVRFRELVRVMLDSELRSLGLKPIGEGDEFLRSQFPKKWWSDDAHQTFAKHEGVY